MSLQVNFRSSFYWTNVKVALPPPDQLVMISDFVHFHFVKNAEHQFPNYWTSGIQLFSFDEYKIWTHLPIIEPIDQCIKARKAL